MDEINNIDIVSEAPDFSMFGLFMQADMVVKSVIIVLIIASIYSWNVIISKILRMRQLKKLEKEFEEIFWSGNSFEDLYETLNFNKSDPKSKIFCAAILEWKKSKSQFDEKSDLNSLKDRMQRSMSVVFNKESENVEKNLTFLATAGSTAPFIGLFGTVWGIMNSFTAIGISQNTSLAVVAPGIAEALFATALGLVAAIPSVLFFNKFNNMLENVSNKLDVFSEEIILIISKELFR